MSIGKKSSLITIAFAIGSLTLSSCGATSAFSKDYCKPVSKIIASFADLEVKTMDDDAAFAEGVKKIISQLQALAQTMPNGAKKNYVLVLAEDFKEFLQPDNLMSAITGLGTDVTPSKVEVICSK